MLDNYVRTLAFVLVAAIVLYMWLTIKECLHYIILSAVLHAITATTILLYRQNLESTKFKE